MPNGRAGFGKIPYRKHGQRQEGTAGTNLTLILSAYLIDEMFDDNPDRSGLTSIGCNPWLKDQELDCVDRNRSTIAHQQI